MRILDDLKVCAVKIPYWERELERAKTDGHEAMIDKAHVMLTEYRNIERHAKRRFKISGPTDTHQPTLF